MSVSNIVEQNLKACPVSPSITALQLYPPPPISHSWKGTGFPIRQFLLNPFKCVRENNHSKMCKRCLQNYVYHVTGKTGIGDKMKSLNEIEWHFLVWYWGARLNKCPNSVCTSSHPHPHPAWSMTLLYEPGMEPPNLLQLHFPLDTILTWCPQYPLQLLMHRDIHRAQEYSGRWHDMNLPSLLCEFVSEPSCVVWEGPLSYVSVRSAAREQRAAPWSNRRLPSKLAHTVCR